MNKRVYERNINYYETDQMQVVHHSNYIRYFEEARISYLNDCGLPYAQMEEMGVMIPVLSVDAEYKTMTRFGDTIEIELGFTSYDGLRFTVSYVIRDKESGEVRCTGNSKHCFLKKDGKPVMVRKKFPKIHEVMMRECDMD